MLGCCCFFSSFSESLEDALLLYKRVTEQYKNEDILTVVRSLIPHNVVLQTKKDGNIISLLKWFKNDFMKWTQKAPVCEKCVNVISSYNSSGYSNRSVPPPPPPMQAQVIIGDSWKMRKVEVFKCSNCNYEYTFPRYGEILKIAEAKTGRCSEWSILFGAILSSIDIEARIVHDFLDHCWNEAKLILDGKWIHVDSTLTYPTSLNHPYYYEESWGKKYEYVLAFTADKVEDVTKRYTQRWEDIQQRRHKNNNKKNATITNLAKFYSDI
jgi:hypothetical protein